MQEHHIQVSRSARYFTLGGQEGPAEEVWYACHGYRQLANRFLSRFDAIAEPGRLIVAPEGLSRFYLEGDGREHTSQDRVGATWMTREDRETEISDYVRYLDHLKDSIESERPGRRVVLGFSQGVHTVCRWVALGRAEPDRLVLWGAYPPRDLPDGAVDVLNRAQIVVVRGRHDPFVTDDKYARLLDRLDEMGLEFDALEHDGAHEIEGDGLRELVRTLR